MSAGQQVHRAQNRPDQPVTREGRNDQRPGAALQLPAHRGCPGALLPPPQREGYLAGPLRATADREQKGADTEATRRGARKGRVESDLAEQGGEARAEPPGDPRGVLEGGAAQRLSGGSSVGARAGEEGARAGCSATYR